MNKPISKGLIRAFNESDEEYKARQAELEKAAPSHYRQEDGTVVFTEVEGDKSQGAGRATELVAPNAHFSEKIYFFPESFNALRRELEENYPTFFHSVVPGFGYSPAWAMVHNAPQFVGFCNGATDLDVMFDSSNVAGICLKFLNAFRAMRGVSPIKE